jgi:hypothetical protein
MKLENITPLKPSKPDVLKEVVVKPEPKLTHTAIGMFKTLQQGELGSKFVIVEIPYNPETMETGQAKEVFRDIREDSIDKFKIKVDELKFFNGE